MKKSKQRIAYISLGLTVLCLTLALIIKENWILTIAFLLVPITYILALIVIIFDKNRTPFLVVAPIILFIPALIGWGIVVLGLMGDTEQNMKGSPMKYELEEGFSRKSKATNLIMNGLKEGHWIEYYDSSSNHVTDSNKAMFYILTIYKNGQPNGMVRKYYKNGELCNKTPYVDDKIDGWQTWYYENGKLERETRYIQNVKNGSDRFFYDNGQLFWDEPYIDGNVNGEDVWYWPNGKLKAKGEYRNGDIIAGTFQEYDENGNEIK